MAVCLYCSSGANKTKRGSRSNSPSRRGPTPTSSSGARVIPATHAPTAEAKDEEMRDDIRHTYVVSKAGTIHRSIVLWYSKGDIVHRYIYILTLLYRVCVSVLCCHLVVGVCMNAAATRNITTAKPQGYNNTFRIIPKLT